MKIEKINDNQIRCTLTREDLASRQLKLSELAYGTEKAKNLFQEMMKQAHQEVGFDSGNAPLMIEAIPVSMDSIVLIITKVEDPEELDTRFSQFASGGDAPKDEKKFGGADDILDLFQKLYDAKSRIQKEMEEAKETASSDKKEEAKEKAAPVKVDLIQAVHFHTLEDAILASKSLTGFFDGKSSLYKDEVRGAYLLALHQGDMSPENFNRVSNILSEYGQLEIFSAPQEAYLLEHGMVMVKDLAIAKLAAL